MVKIGRWPSLKIRSSWYERSSPHDSQRPPESRIRSLQDSYGRGCVCGRCARSPIRSIFTHPAGSEETDGQMINYQLAREELVESLERKGIRDLRVLAALREIKRHLFVPNSLRHRAYEDAPLSIGEGQTISQPFMVARMTELLGLEGNEKVLEIGTGSGYQAAILSRLASKVFTVERISMLARQAEERFEKMGLTNIMQRVGDGSLGWKQVGPFDGIVVTAASPHIPTALTDQLTEGGRLVIPTGPRRVQDLKLVTKTGDDLKVTSHGGCVFVPLIGSHGWTD